MTHLCTLFIALCALCIVGIHAEVDEFADLDPVIARDLKARMRDLGMYDAKNNSLGQDVTIQPFVDRQQSDGTVIPSSFLAVRWPSEATDYDMSFVAYLPDGDAGTMHAVHICGFLLPENCENKEPYPGKTRGRCGISDEAYALETKFFCDFVTLTEVPEDADGAIILEGTEDLERFEGHMMNSGWRQQMYPPELHFEIVEIGDEGFDYADAPAPAPAPDPAQAPAPTTSSTAAKAPSNRRLLNVRGPAFAGLQMTMRAGPGGRGGRNGRSSFITLPGSLNG